MEDNELLAASFAKRQMFDIFLPMYAISRTPGIVEIFYTVIGAAKEPQPVIENNRVVKKSPGEIGFLCQQPPCFAICCLRYGSAKTEMFDIPFKMAEAQHRIIELYVVQEGRVTEAVGELRFCPLPSIGGRIITIGVKGPEQFTHWHQLEIVTF